MLLTTLVNKEHRIKNNFLDKVVLITTKGLDGAAVQVEENTYKAFLELQAFLKEKGITIGISSAYRSFAEQEEIYNNYVQEYGLEYAKEIVAPVGYSEHHTGMAIDLAVFLEEHYLVDNDEVMKNVPIYEEVEKYLADFGFILRYPKDKKEVTKYSYEPWHIRYVSKFIANIIKKNNWTLEQYLTNFAGIIAVNKEKGMTSFDVVKEIKRLFGIEKVGHTGTLDPLATGVLLVAIGKAVKIVELLTCEQKEYIASVKLGIKTDTLDITGKVLAQQEISNDIDITTGVKYFQKTYLQEVPIYSAVKVKGKKLYEYARKQQEVILPKKEVTIKEIDLLEKTKDSFTFKALVSKGCYIRSLINDICNYLGIYGTMSSLVRTKQGNINIDDTYKLQEIKNNNYKLLSISDVLAFKVVVVDKEVEKKIRNGVLLDNKWDITDKVIFENTAKQLLGIYELKDNKLKVWKNF